MSYNYDKGANRIVTKTAIAAITLFAMGASSFTVSGKTDEGVSYRENTENIENTEGSETVAKHGLRLEFVSPAKTDTKDVGDGFESNAENVTDNPGNALLNVSAQVRFDYQHTSYDGNTSDSNSGFEGQYLLLKLNGTIAKGLTYSWRHRLNRPVKDSHFFDGADWLYLRYDYGRWSFSAGKEVVAIGGYEYDANPINLFGTSVFWNNIGCFQVGATVGYNVTADDRIALQMTESPSFTPEDRNLYSYNLMWYGQHGIYSSLWSANMVEYRPGHFINYISLGNRLELGKWEVELDFMNRASSHQTFFFKDCSVIGNVAFNPGERWRIHGKFTYDVNKSGTDADVCVLNGTELKMIGGGLEYYPLKNDRTALRAHATAYYSWGNNANRGDLMQNKTLLLSVGLSWRMDFLSLVK